MKSFRDAIRPERREVARFVTEVQDLLRAALSEENSRDGTNQQRLADAMGVDKAQISRWLNGANKNITIESFALLAYYLKRRLHIQAEDLATQTASVEILPETTLKMGCIRNAEFLHGNRVAFRFSATPNPLTQAHTPRTVLGCSSMDSDDRASTLYNHTDRDGFVRIGMQ